MSNCWPSDGQDEEDEMDVVTEMQEAVQAAPEQAPAAPPEPTEAQCWEQLGRWGQAERELLAQLQQVRGEYQAWLGKLQAARQ